jgi:hypothetical protein
MSLLRPEQVPMSLLDEVIAAAGRRLSASPISPELSLMHREEDRSTCRLLRARCHDRRVLAGGRAWRGCHQETFAVDAPQMPTARAVATIKDVDDCKIKLSQA